VSRSIEGRGFGGGAQGEYLSESESDKIIIMETRELRHSLPCTTRCRSCPNLNSALAQMSVTCPESQDSLFIQPEENIPPTLARASQRLQFPPLYVIVGVYRLFTDKLLYVPVWNRCKHVQKGALVGAIWVSDLR